MWSSNSAIKLNIEKEKKEETIQNCAVPKPTKQLIRLELSNSLQVKIISLILIRIR